MDDNTRLGYLRIALRVFGLVFILGIYATLGVFLFLAAKDPAQHLSLISFAIWSSVVHGLIMAVQSVASPEHVGHLYGDVLALFVVAGVLAYLSPAAARVGVSRAVA